MYSLLVKLYLIAALMQLGLSLTTNGSVDLKTHLQKVDRESKKVLKIDWKPISVFPEEAKRFR